uniref:divalent-cation tolerance protein CutA n=1 Tax=Altererythrobacter segetis TaxID=1104773 RepID=UPI00140B0C82|nr:divalent-cation tolerance protein CutA [Altererythrobacter segetis]
MSAALIWSPFESEEAAAKAASQLLDEGLIACANIFPGVRSLYVWQGERGEAKECGALFKTEAGLLDRAVARLAAIHPYETPAIAGWRADAVPPSTAAWLGELV